VYVGYPVVIWILSRIFGHCAQPPQSCPDIDLPRLSLLIAAYNEESVIEDRILNALELDYPPEKLEIVVASDGSSDRTNAIVSRYLKRGVRLFDYSPRQGKASVLNRAFTQLSGDIVILSDANTNTEPDAARHLVRWFQDPKVGVVCGRLLLIDPKTGRNVDGLYWKYETFLKKCEGRLGALLGVNGALYAIRRELYCPVPEGTIVDDLVIPLSCQIRTGNALVFDSKAVALEETAPDVSSEFRRRSRLGAGGFQSLGLLWPLLNPRRGWIAFTFLSHKVLRWVCPFAMAGLFFFNLALLLDPVYQLTLASQLGFYLVAGTAAFIPGQSRSMRLLRLTTMFVGMNAALFVGICRWFAGRQNGVWKRTARAAEMSAGFRTAAGVGVYGPMSESALALDRVLPTGICDDEAASAADGSGSVPSLVTGASESKALANS